MAYIDNTALVAYQTRDLQKEIKIPQVGAIEFAKQQTQYFPNLTPELVNKIRNANGQAIQMSAIKEGTVTVGTAFTFDIPMNLGETAYQTVTIYQFWAGFNFFEYDFANNAVAKQAYLQAKYEECDKALANAISTQLITNYNSRRTQVLTTTGAPSGIAFDATADALEVSLALRSTNFLDNFNTLMKQNRLVGTYSMLNSWGMAHILAYHKMYGSNNEKNLLNQMMPSMFYDDNITVTTGSDATSYLVKDGAFGIVESVPVEFASGARVGDAIWSYGDMEMPITKMRPLLYQETFKADTSSLTSSDRPTSAMTVGTKIGIGHSFGFVQTYNSAIGTRANDCVRVDMLNA
jgi:hypothetical protein